MNRFQNILASLDTRQNAHPALEWAAVLAQANGARLKLIDVLPEFGWQIRLALPDFDHVRSLLLDEKRQRLESLAAPLREKGLAVSTVAASGKTSVEVIREVLRGEHDLVVRVTKGAQSRQSRFFGNTTWRLFRNCPCPVWAVRPDAPTRFQRVLAAVDPAPRDVEHDQLNDKIMELVRAIAQQVQGRFDVLHVWSFYGEHLLANRVREEELRPIRIAAQDHVRRAFARFLDDYGLTLDSENVHLIEGERSRAIVEFVNRHGFDLLVIGTVARTGATGLLMGNTAEEVLSQVQCSVLAVKPDDFRTSVRLPEA